MTTNLLLRSQNRARGFSGVPGTEFRRQGGERVVGNDGHINASNNRDLMVQIAALLDAREQGEINDHQEVTASVKQKHEALAAAFHDKNSTKWEEIGAFLAGELTEGADREGFMRRLLMQAEVTQGGLPRIRSRKRGVTAVVAANNGGIYPQFARDSYYYPPEFTIATNVRIEHRELNQGTGDILEEKFIESQEAIMVAEDRMWKKMVNKITGVANPVQALVGGLTPANFVYMRELITDWNNSVSKVVMAGNLWSDIVANAAFGAWFDPVSKYEIVNTGYLGNLLGLELITDGYRHPSLKVLEPGEIYMVAAPETHGAYTSRGPVQSIEAGPNPDTGSLARGWFMYEELSMLIFNPRSVVRGVRV